MTEKQCRKCKMVKPVEQFSPRSGRDGYQSYCKSCYRVLNRERDRTPKRCAYNKKLKEKLREEGYFRDYFKRYSQRPEVKKRKREQQKEYRNDPRLKIRHLARWYTNHRIAAGTINKEPCAFCGKEQVEAHHLDYERPILIVWLCSDCHRRIHAKAEPVDK